MSESVELELRGKFSSKQELLSFISSLKSRATFIEERQRLSVILTTLNDKGIDIQLRMHGHKCQLVTKVGKHTSTSRRETVVKIDKEEFLPTLKLLDSLGIRDGVVAEAQDWIFKLGDIEIKATLCDEKIFVWELEALTKKVNEKDLEGLAYELGLTPLNSRELTALWSWMKKYANKKYKSTNIGRIYSGYLARLGEK